MHKYGESKMTRIVMATVRHVTFSSGLRKFQAAWILLNRGYFVKLWSKEAKIFCLLEEIRLCFNFQNKIK